MKLCPSCKAELDENARFCLCCMTSLEKKEQIQPPKRRIRRWPFVVLCVLLLGCAFLVILAVVSRPSSSARSETEPSLSAPAETHTTPPQTTPSPEAPAVVSRQIDGITYTFSPATEENYPVAISLAHSNYFVLTKVEGIAPDGFYLIPSFVDNDLSAPVVAVLDGAFADTNATRIDLGHNVRLVSDNAFEGCILTDLYLHSDVYIDQAAFSQCSGDFTIHCSDFLENTKDELWSELAVKYGFQWQPIAL